MSSPFLTAQRTELDRLGFKVIHEIPNDLIMAAGRRFYWDCLLTFINYTVFVRQVEVLSAQVMESDRTRFQTLAKEQNPSSIPRGLQSGNAVLVVYVAQQVDSDAQKICQKPRSISGFAKFFLAGALETSTGQQYYSTKSPLVGAIYFAKFRYLITRLLDPVNALQKEPLSKSGVILLIVSGILIAISLITFLAAIIISTIG